MGAKIPGIETLLSEALEIPTAEGRAAYLDRACGGDEELRRQVESLLAAHARAGEFLASPAARGTATWDGPRSEGPGTSIGPYKLMEPIGEGGMGVVYVAEQRAPVRRKVALKVIKPGMDSQQVIARFEAERQALAMLDHPNIAKIYDGGVTESGRPYFVMELVPGVPITEYCDRERLSIRDRLELFVLVCRAVQHAHQKGIIHRDLKPSNILVTLHDGVPVPKVIDFGVAKATGGGLTEKTIYTAFAQLVGTPLYMSPEQVELSGLDIDTRSDIYSLGVLLYELLTGTTPFESETLRQAGFDEMRRIIREEEPPRPSTRLSTLGASLTTTSAQRSSDPRHLNRSVRGELDWIAMKALEKDRRRRYETANDFAADVMRYLTDRPVEACPPSAWYRFSKLARRNRVTLTTAALVAVALIVGTSVSLWQAIRATRADRESRRQASMARKAVDEMYTQFAEKMLADHARLDTVQQEFLLKALAYYQEFAREAGTSPEVRREVAKASSRVGKIRHLLGKYDEAVESYLRASTLYEGLSRDFPDRLEYEQELAQSSREIGHQLTHLGKERQARGAVQRAIAILQRRATEDPQNLQHRRDLAKSYSTIGTVLEGLGRDAEAEDACRKARELNAELAADGRGEPDDWDRLAGTELTLGNLLAGRGREQETEDAYTRAREIGEKLMAEHPNRPEYRSGLAKSLDSLAVKRMFQTGGLKQAEELNQRAIELGETLVAEYPDRSIYRVTLANGNINFGVLLAQIKRPREAEVHFRRALELYQKLATDFPAVPDYRYGVAKINANLGALRYDTGRREEGEPFFRRSLEIYEKLVIDFPEHLSCRDWLAQGYSWFAEWSRESGKLEEAEWSYRRGIEVAEALVAAMPDNPNYRFRPGCAQNDLGIVLMSRRQMPEARRLFERGIVHQQAALRVDPKHPGCRGLLRKLYKNLARMLVGDDPDSAVRMAQKAIDLREKQPDSDLWQTLGWAEYRRGNWQASIDALEKSIALQGGADAFQWFFLAMSHWQLGDRDRARSYYEQANSWLEQNYERKRPPPENLPEIRRFRDEAKALLGVDKSPAGKSGEPPRMEGPTPIRAG